MSAFLAVNSARAWEDHSFARKQDVPSPTTPRAITSSSLDDLRIQSPDESSPNTPTRQNFGGRAPQQTAHSDSPQLGSSPGAGTARSGPVDGLITRADSQRSVRSRDSQDVDMAISDDEQAASDNDAGADGDERPSKKKKGQRFYCTEFPPCTLSFTRSEHLARHIRKHTGERPFQCHCSRRFSRLDNLRQHAQTVHINEEIPNDSLAATGTRFQRQIRTDRVRPGSRPRTSTIGGQSNHGRGHSRNLSSSSIGSTASSVSYRDDVRRRPPPPLVMTSNPSQSRLSIDVYASPSDSPGGGDVYQAYSAQSPGGYSTPTSATFSTGTGPGSPRFGAGLRSPTSTGPPWTSRNPLRRLSVPSGANPFQSPLANQYSRPYFSPLASATGSILSGQSSAYGSPTSSVFSQNREFASQAAQDAELKRRTWHPESRSSFNSPLANGSLAYPSPAQSSYGQSGVPSAVPRLPGIESFDRAPPQQPTPPRGISSPMQLDPPARSQMRPGLTDRPATGPDGRRNLVEWDMSLHRNLNRLGISSSTPTKEVPQPWPHQPETTPTHPTTFQDRPHQQPHPPSNQDGDAAKQTLHEAGERAAEASNHEKQLETSRRTKRQAWYNGPLSSQRNLFPHRTSPEDSSSSEGVPTPSSSSVGEFNPSIRHSNGYVEPTAGVAAVENQKAYETGSGSAYAESYAPPAAAMPGEAGPTAPMQGGGSSHSTAPPPPHEPPRRDGSMLRLEALVAVATSEDK